MEIRGEHRFPAARSLVWEKLLDPETLRTSIPGCEDLKEVGPDSYDM
ncbi:MAG: SRPBCC domain-containing protein, partial [Dehalococcoidia bacterium]